MEEERRATAEKRVIDASVDEIRHQQSIQRVEGGGKEKLLYPHLAVGIPGETCRWGGRRVPLYAAGTPYQVTWLTGWKVFGTAGERMTGYMGVLSRHGRCAASKGDASSC